MARVSAKGLGLLAVGALLVLLGGGCGGSSSKTAANVVPAGQLNVQLPAGSKATPAGGTAAVTTTVPLDKQNPTTAFFQATTAFNGCLRSLGVTFVGNPDPSNPSSPTNNPTYLKNLQKCGAQSNIIQALQAFQASQNNLTPTQIHQENERYLSWRTCMIGRGWTIPTPTPDSQGRLFAVNPTPGAPQIVPPAGETLGNSPDIQACAAQSQLGGSGG